MNDDKPFPDFSVKPLANLGAGGFKVRHRSFPALPGQCSTPDLLIS
jgi:hypothetical protein